MSTETHITHGSADRIGPLLESGFFTTEEARRGVPHSGVHHNEGPVGEFNSTLQSAHDKGYVRTEGPLRTSDLPLELQNVTERKKSRKPIAAVAALSLAGLGIFAATRGGEDDTPRTAPPVAAGTTTPGRNFPEIAPPATNTAPTPSETGDFLERKNQPYIEAQVPENMLNFDFLNKYDMAKVDPSLIKKYTDALPEVSLELETQELLVSNIKAEDIAKAKERINTLLNAKYTMVKDGELISGVPADKFYANTGFMPGTTMPTLEWIANAHSKDATVQSQVVATELYNSTLFAAPAVDAVVKQSQQVNQYIVQHPEDAGFQQSEINPDDPARLSELNPDGDTIRSELANAGTTRAIIDGKKAYIARVYDRLTPLKSPDGTTTQIKAFTLIGETTAQELVIRLVVAVPLDTRLESDPATFELSLDDVSGGNYFQIIPVRTKVLK